MSDTAIDIKIDSAYRKSESLYKAKTTWQQDIDTLLDRMNELNRLMTDLHTLLLNITFEIERDMKGFKESKMAPRSIKKIVSNSVKILNRVQRSVLYPGVKTTYYTLHQEISYLNELVVDRSVGISLDTDAEMAEIIKGTIKAANRK
jgi:hypothetical protein